MQDIINKLNNGNLIVGVAGPGAGKTHTFKKIIDSKEYKDKKILILSFINKLISDLGKDFSAYTNVEVKTLHAFANKYLGKVEMVESLDKIISEDYLYIKDISFDYLKNLCTNDLTDIKNIDAYNFYKERKKFYEKENKIYSFNSSILAVNILFGKDANKIPKYDLILIDEFQDFNQLEYNLIQILNSKSKIIIVGDDDQSLYEFKSAMPSIIRDLYNDISKEKFSLDYCRRCTKVIVDSVNNLIAKSKEKGLLNNRIDKKFLYPENENKSKDELSGKNKKIDFLPKLQGNKLLYELSIKIKQEMGDSKDKRVLILASKHYHQTLYNGLLKEGFNVVDYELFANEKKDKITHKNLISAFNTLVKRKTDDLNLRLVLGLYLNESGIKKILKESKNIWNCLDGKIKENIKADIALFKKAKKGSDSLFDKEIVRLNQLFNLKNIISKMVNGFERVKSKSIEVEIVTAMSSKGLSADLVYYVYVDDEELFGKDKKLTDNKICEFLVGITRTKEKLTLISKKDLNPLALKLLGETNINVIDTN